jgi:hypothetical protein
MFKSENGVKRKEGRRFYSFSRGNVTMCIAKVLEEKNEYS